VFSRILRILVATSICTSPAAASADQFVFRYKTPISLSTSVPEDPGFGVGNDITVYFTGAIGYAFTKKIPVATNDVVEWRRSKGSYQPGLALDADTGVISGIPSGATEPKNTILLGYDVTGKLIARADITFRFYNPVGAPQNLVFYGHTNQYMYRVVPASVNVSRWEALAPLPTEFKTEAQALVGTPAKTYNTGVSFIGYDYTGKEVAFASGDLIVEPGPVVERIGDQFLHPGHYFDASASVVRHVGNMNFRLIAFDGKPDSLRFDSTTGRLEGVIGTFNTALRFQIEVIDEDGTKGISNVFTFSTFAPDLDLSALSNLSATVGYPYGIQLGSKDLSGSMDWQVVSGSLPDGIALDPDTGIVSGTPTKEESQENIQISVTTSDGGSDTSNPFTFKVNPADIEVTFTPILKRINENFASVAPRLASGVVAPYSFAAAAGSTVDPAITVNYGTATVSGKIATAGDYDVAFNLLNGDGHEKTFLQPVGIFNPLSVSYANVITAYRRVPLSATPTVPEKSVIGAASLVVSQGALPDGLSLNKYSGAITGAPTTIGITSGIKVTISDESKQSSPSNAFSIDVQDRPNVVATAASASVERFVANQVSVASSTNAFGGVQYSISSGSLPHGLTIDENGAIIGHTEDPEGQYGGIVVRATDGEGYFDDADPITVTVVKPKDLNGLAASDTSRRWTVGIPFDFVLPKPQNAFGNVTYAFEGLPAGVLVDSEHLLGAIPTVGSYTFQVTISDDTGRSLKAPFTLNILEPMSASLSATTQAPGQARASLLRSAPSSTFNLPRGSQALINATIENGIEPISYSFNGSLPVGLNYDTGIISGTPVLENETKSVVLTVTDAAGSVQDLPMTLKVAARQQVQVAYDFSPLLIINSTANLPRKPTLKNAIGPVTYDIAGALPPGIKFDAATGWFTGAPTVDGRFKDIEVTATDSEGSAYAGSTGEFEIDVSRAGTISLATATTYVVRTGSSFTKSIVAGNATAPLTFAVTSANLPAGVSLDEKTGVVSGTLTSDGTSTFAVTVTDDFGRSKTTAVTIKAVGPLSLTAPIGADLIWNQFSAKSVSPKLVNPIGNVIYELAGTLPDGLSFSTTSGSISGTPKTKGSATGIVVKVMDSSGSTAQTAPFAVTVTDRLPLTVPLATSYPVFANLNYKLTVPVSNGVGKVAFTQTGTLPTGISFDPVDGIFSGSATVVGTFNGITVTVSDEGGGSVTKTFSFVVSTNGNPISLTVTDFITKVGKPVTTVAPAWSNSVGNIRFWADDLLNDYGLSINPDTGVISGTARQIIDITPNLHITDSSDRVTSKPIRIQVIPNMVISAPSQVNLTVNTPMTAVTATRQNVIGSANWTYVGTLPAGVSFNNGTFTGISTEMGTFTGTISSTDSLGDTGTAPISITVKTNGLPPTISVAVSSTGYQTNLATPITPAYGNRKVGDVVALAPGSGALPPSVSLIKNASGDWILYKAIGTDADVGVFRGVNLRVTDVDGLYSETGPKDLIIAPVTALAYANQTIASRANAPVNVAARAPSQGKAIADVSFKFTTDVTGGKLVIDPQTGAISGTFTSSGANVVTVTEGYDGKTIRTFTYFVSMTATQIKLTTWPMALNIGRTQTETEVISASGQIQGAVFSAAGLPQGVSINPVTGALNGSVDAAAGYADGAVLPVTYTVTDGYGTTSVTQSLTILNGQPKRFWMIEYYTSQGYEDVYEMQLLGAGGVNHSLRVGQGTATYQSQGAFSDPKLSLDGNDATGVRFSGSGWMAIDFGGTPVAVTSFRGVFWSALDWTGVILRNSNDGVKWNTVYDMHKTGALSIESFDVH
jgi:hypothetical protein